MYMSAEWNVSETIVSEAVLEVYFRYLMIQTSVKENIIKEYDYVIRNYDQF